MYILSTKVIFRPCFRLKKSTFPLEIYVLICYTDCMKKITTIATLTLAALFLFSALSCESTGQVAISDKNADNASLSREDEKNSASAASDNRTAKIQVKKILQDIKITVVSSPKETVKGKNFASPYKILVTNTEDSPYSSLKITAEYPSDRTGDTLSYAKQTIVTGEDGTAVFTPPVPAFSVNSSVSFYPEVSSSDPELMRLCTKVAGSAPWKVRTNLSTYTGILVSILDYRQNGSMNLGTGAQPSTQALTNFLWRNRLMGAQNADFHNSVDADDPVRIRNDALKQLNGNSLFHYVVYGRVKYAGEIVKDADGYYSVTFTGDLGAIEIKTGKVLLKASKTVTVRDKSEWKLISAAQQEMARLFGEEVLYAL